MEMDLEIFKQQLKYHINLLNRSVEHEDYVKAAGEAPLIGNLSYVCLLLAEKDNN